MASPVYDDVVNTVKAANTSPQADTPTPATTTTTTGAATLPKRKKTVDPTILPRDAIKLGQTATTKNDAIRQAGGLLVALGATDPTYTDGMLARELQVSTFMGNGVAIPHGTNESRTAIKKTQLAFLQYPDGIDWNGKTCYVTIPIASTNDEHVSILSALANVLADKTKAETLRTTTNIDEVLQLLAPEEG